MNTFTKGQAVRINPIAYPTSAYNGVVLRKTPRGYKCQYQAGEFVLSGVFYERELMDMAQWEVMKARRAIN